jgi:ClpX C4-type zinc finger
MAGPAGSRRGPQPVACSFCARTSPESGAVVMGLGRTIICEHCVRAAQSLMFGTAVATGELPTDLRLAEQGVGAAFAAMNEISADGHDLPNVDGGEGLAEYVRQGNRRYPDAAATFSVDRIRFLGADEAEVFFTIEAMGTSFPRVGRALLVDDRWVVSRETLAEALQGAGIYIPRRT